MLRPLPLLFAVLLPAAAAPTPPGVRPEFGSNGLLSRADLEQVRFDSRPVGDGEKFDDVKVVADEEKAGAAPRPRNRYDLAVHLPWAAFREGEPVPAHFVLRNNRGSSLSLDARLELFGPEPITWNSCGIDVRDAKTREPVHVVGRGGWACGGGGLVDVPADGFYCARGDLGRAAGGKPLPPGEYEVDWRYGRLRSAPVRFTVAKSDRPVPPAAKRPGLHFYHLTPEGERRPAEPGGPVVWRDARLGHVHAATMASALAVGHGGASVPDPHIIPAADRLVEASVEWRPYRDGDRVSVTLRAAAPFERVAFAEVPQLHLQVEAPGDVGPETEPEPAEAKEGDQLRSDALVTPLTVEARLPVGWRERCGFEGTARVAVLVTSGPIELPRGGRQVERVKRDEVRTGGGAGDRPPVWAGVVRTGFVELRFPPPGP